MSIKIGNNIVAKSSTYHPDLFDVKWSDHILDNISWLRADTFSWHSGELYNKAYEHLLDDWNNSELSEEAIPGLESFKVRVAPDGHKMVSTTNDGPERVQEVFEATGIAWYYIIDLVNHRFKLPRTKFAFTGVRDNVGKFVEAGLPNVEGTLQWSNATGIYRPNGSSTGAFYKGTTRTSGMAGTDIAGCADLCFDASKSNEIYGNSDTVQPKSTEMYLYFYVGNFAQNDLQNVAGGIQDKDTAVNYDNITNCITEIPQDLKIVIEEGVLKLKAGSKYYVPNGFEEDGTTRHFDVIVTTEDKVAVADTSRTAVHWVWAEGAHIDHPLPAQWCFSGNTAPVPPTWYANKYAFWYDTANNKCKWTDDAGVTWVEGMSLPICIATEKTTEYVNIDQIFNGFGYIGSIVYTLPGISALAPDGRNEDGTLKSIKCITTKVDVKDIAPYTGTHLPLCLDNEGNIQYQTYYYEQEENPNKDWSVWYKPSENIIYWRQAEGYAVEDYIQGKYCVVGFFDRTVGVVSNFKLKNTFQAADYNTVVDKDIDNISSSGISKIINMLTPDYSKPVSISSWPYNIPSAGWIRAEIHANNNEYGKRLLYTTPDGATIGFGSGALSTGNYSDSQSVMIIVEAGGKINRESTAIAAVFYPMKGLSL